ncbi:MAG TPA: biotin--[acetyl-CoA-carboxylase] ligase [Mycobacteriales bacterium]|nr:biotin--[acetyl-CoA-carboxylase] ligase [Mycobacteriales bacterium]
MSHPYSELDRPPLSARTLAPALVRPGGLWTSLTVVAETGSTNADLLAAAQAGAPSGAVLVAESQTAGRGRLDRTWVSPPRAGLTFSILLRPEVDRSAWSWLPLLVGVAVAEAIERHAEVEARLKWPNDLLLDGLKLAGILAQAADDAVVVGIGLNVLTRLAELPPGGGSLLSAGAVRTDRDPVLRAVLRSIETQYLRWTDAGGDAEACGLRAAYRSSCDTLGHQVDITLPTGGSYRGVATDVDVAGRLVVDGRTFAVGDVTHVRRSAAGTL